MSFSENLVRLQAKNKESNYRLAKDLGVHATTVQNWREGMRPRLEHAARVAEHYGLTVDELMADAPEQDQNTA